MIRESHQRRRFIAHALLGGALLACVALFLYPVGQSAFWPPCPIHRFLGIELVVDRTLVYAPVTGLLALAFIGTLWVTQRLLHSVLGGPTEVAIVVAAGINAALFRPAERRVRAEVQRRLRPTEAREARGA